MVEVTLANIFLLAPLPYPPPQRLDFITWQN